MPRHARCKSSALAAALAASCAFWGQGAAAPVVRPRAPVKSSNPYGVAFLPLYQGERLWANLRDLGVGWIRFDLWVGQADHESHFQPAIDRAIDEGYGLWITIYHRDAANVSDPARLSRSRRGGLPAADMARYEELLRSRVGSWAERIRKRGGVPARRLVVQIENEVAPADIAAPNPNRFWHGTADEYLDQLARSYQAVKSVDSAIPVAAAGLASEGLEWAISGSHRQARAAASWMERLLREGRYDLADAHLYHRVEAIPAKIAWVRARAGRPIAVTEAGGPDERSRLRYSDAANAEDLEARLPAALAAGVTHVFWLGLSEAPTADRLGQTVALTRADASRKPSFESFRRIIRTGNVEPRGSPP